MATNFQAVNRLERKPYTKAILPLPDKTVRQYVVYGKRPATRLAAIISRWKEDCMVCEANMFLARYQR